MSENFWLALVAAISTIMTTAISGVIAYYLAKLKAEADRVAVELRATTSSTTARLQSLSKTTGDTHTLVNSNMGVQLHLNAAVSRRLASLTGDPDDAAAAILAEQLYHEHQAKQKVVDEGEVTT